MGIIERSGKRKGGVIGRTDKLLNSNSEVTIYRNALIDQTDGKSPQDHVDKAITEGHIVESNRLSSSLDEPIDTSDELMEVSENECDKMRVDEMVSNFIAENRPRDRAEKDTQ